MKKLLAFLLRTTLLLFVLANIVLAFHAYKFTHYYNVGEIVTKADADKTGWDKTKEILFGLNFTKQPNGPKPALASEVVLINTEKDSLKAWYTALPQGTAKGTVLLFHGHGSQKGALNDEAAVFQQLGYHTLQLDFRAHGSSGGNTTTIGFYEAEDVKLAWEYIAAKGEKNILLYGASMGAATVSKAIADYNLSPSKIILEMPFASLNQAAAGRIKMMGLPPQPMASLLTFWGGTLHGFWAFGLKPAAYVKSIKCPVLLQWGLHDNRVMQEETDEIFKNISSPKKLVVYKNSGHESFCDKEHDKWVSEVSRFLNE
jgi:uncharacterized protein